MPVKKINISVKAADIVPLSRLKIIQGDLKSLSDENFAALCAEILTKGFSFAIHVWDDGTDLCVLDGTQRHRVLSHLLANGYTDPSDGIHYACEMDGVPINYVEAPDIQTAVKKLLGAAGNYGKPEEEGLYQLMHKFGIKPIEIKNIRLPGIKINQFLESHFEEYEGQCDPDEVPEPRVEPNVKLGDLFQLGNHRLLCGDSTDKVQVERLMNGEKADMVFTDPPYGMNLDADYSNMKMYGYHSRQGNGNKYRQVQGDDKDFDANAVLIPFEYCKEIFLWGADYYKSTIPRGGSWVVWDKRSTASGATTLDRQFGSCFELCWSKGKHKREIARILHAGCFSVENDKREHPTQKPVALPEWFFERWGKDARLVVDLYLGSGSTLIACEKTNRKCYGSEIDPHYCDVIVRRWEKYTGKTAYLIEEACGERLKEPVPFAELNSMRSMIPTEENKNTALKNVGR